MVRIILKSGSDEGKSFLVSKNVDPAFVLRDLVCMDVEWELDYELATEREMETWPKWDAIMTCQLFLERDFPIEFRGQSFYDIEAFKEVFLLLEGSKSVSFRLEP